MEQNWSVLTAQAENFVFLGEAGCGKSEIAVNLALHLARAQEKEVHFFDMDQTKPLFRSRDVRKTLEDAGVVFHCEEQMADAPTLVGGVAPLLLRQDAAVILDVGGGDTGARLIGGFSHLLGRENTAVFYIVNPYRAWSGDILAIDGTLSAVLRAARVQKVRYLINPNLGTETTPEEFADGVQKGLAMLSPYVTVEAAFVSRKLAGQVRAELPLLPLELYLAIPWQ
jgi:energy-coupling factor transporter ATP-binding protein EcfA2